MAEDNADSAIPLAAAGTDVGRPVRPAETHESRHTADAANDLESDPPDYLDNLPGNPNGVLAVTVLDEERDPTIDAGYPLVLSSRHTVHDLRLRIQGVHPSHPPPDRQRLTYSGRLLPSFPAIPLWGALSLQDSAADVRPLVRLQILPDEVAEEPPRQPDLDDWGPATWDIPRHTVDDDPGWGNVAEDPVPAPAPLQLPTNPAILLVGSFQQQQPQRAEQVVQSHVQVGPDDRATVIIALLAMAALYVFSRSSSPSR